MTQQSVSQIMAQPGFTTCMYIASSNTHIVNEFHKVQGLNVHQDINIDITLRDFVFFVNTYIYLPLFSTEK